MQDLRKFVRIQTSLSNEVRMNAPTTMSNCIVFLLILVARFDNCAD